MTLRTHENGSVCCDSHDPKLRCAKCQAHLAEEARTLRGAADYTPLDPYKDAITRLQQADAKAAAERTHTPTPRPTAMPLDANGIPDPYASALDAMRRETR